MYPALLVLFYARFARDCVRVQRPLWSPGRETRITFVTFELGCQSEPQIQHVTHHHRWLQVWRWHTLYTGCASLFCHADMFPSFLLEKLTISQKVILQEQEQEKKRRAEGRGERKRFCGWTVRSSLCDTLSFFIASFVWCRLKCRRWLSIVAYPCRQLFYDPFGCYIYHAVIEPRFLMKPLLQTIHNAR